MTLRISFLITAAAVALAAATIAAQEPRYRLGGLSPAIESLAGRDTYTTYCAGCHGAGGRGDGRIAPTLKSRVPDLTGFARANGGAFPRERVVAAIRNADRPITAHLTGDMPVWETVFGILDPSTEYAAARIDGVVTFIETLQEGVPASAASGRALFVTYCATCHGADARGGGWVSEALRHEVPDLTRLASGNGGVFPSARVARIIDGRDVALHGSREMPIWGDAFRRAPGGSRSTPATRIESVLLYLQGMQQVNLE
jgi:mono/diheme cytochrome c family protein